MIPYYALIVNQQDGLIVQESSISFPITSTRHLNISKADRTSRKKPVDECELFECPKPGCQQTFKRFPELEIHVQIGDHGHLSVCDSIYDRMRREWAKCVSSVDQVEQVSDSGESIGGLEQAVPALNIRQWWALSKQRVLNCFTPNVKEYLNKKFDFGVKTGFKAEPEQVTAEMRNSRDEQNNHRFSREEWLTANQIKSYFSRLASSRRKGQEVADDEAELEDILYWEKRKKVTDSK